MFGKKVNAMVTKKVYLWMLIAVFSVGIPMNSMAADGLKTDLGYNPMDKAVAGQRYEAMVTDTLDLADRMGLAINALTNVWIPEERWSLQFVVDFSRKPPVLSTNHKMDAYLNIPPKFIEALALCRLASGSRQNIDTDYSVLRAQLELIADNGLTYTPSDALTKLSATSMGDESKPFAEVWAEGRQLIALSMLSQIDKSGPWMEIGKQKIDTMLSLVREKDGIEYIWTNRYFSNIEVPEDAPVPEGFTAGYIIGALGHGSGLFYRATGYKPALELSESLARWAVTKIFKNEDGRYDFFHFHHGLYILMAVCEYGEAANDRQILERVDACYRWARGLGDPLIGFYPEAMPGSEWYLGRNGNTVETCEITDMVWLALYLTRAGIGDYWDDVDRWVRNMYAEAQMLNTDFLNDIPDGYFNPEATTHTYQNTDNIAEKMVGSFWGWMRANEGLDNSKTPNGPKLSPIAIMHCCTANGARTLYHVWDSIVTKKEDTVYVNLLLNRASLWLDVDSYLPADGKVILRIKNSQKIAVRIPEWCKPQDVDIKINGTVAQAMTQGQYMYIYMLKPDDQVELNFDVPTRIVNRVLGEIPYKLTLRGSNVIDIDPKGIACPLYQNQPTGKLIKKQRFIPDTQDIIW